MKSINSRISQIGLTFLRSCSPAHISSLQAWLRALADALPGLSRQPDKTTLEEIKMCNIFEKQQAQTQVTFKTEDGKLPFDDGAFKLKISFKAPTEQNTKG